MWVSNNFFPAIKEQNAKCANAMNHGSLLLSLLGGGHIFFKNYEHEHHGKRVQLKLRSGLPQAREGLPSGSREGGDWEKLPAL